MKQRKHSTSQGFTLIELMATMVVGIILLATGGATYFSFQERQEAEKVATELQRFAVQTRARARSQDKEGCPSTSVVGYSLIIDPASQQVTSTGFCGTGKYTAIPGGDVASYTIPAPVDVVFDGTTVVDAGVITSTRQVEFFSLMGGATVAHDTHIDISRGGVTHRFTISPGGEISGVIKL